MANGNETGRDGDDRLYFLWHLQQIGLFDDQTVPQPPAIWQRDLRDVGVALIDAGCTRRHPNLPGDALRCPLDVCVSPAGAVFRAEDAAAAAAAWQTLPAKIEPILALLPDTVRVVVQGVAADMAGRAPLLVPEADPADRFGRHGTACAGLVAGRRLRVPPAGAAPTLPGAVLPYFGVNPFATIVPVATPYSHEIRPLITALLHAVACDVDVILMPRAVNEVTRGAGLSPEDRAADSSESRITRDPRLADDKLVFEHLLAAIATTRPVILAAGNEGVDRPAYPASLKSNAALPGADRLIVVGAVNHLGYPSSYSNGPKTVELFAPSDDEEAVDTRGIRFDRRGELAPAFLETLTETGAPRLPYSPFAVLALEVPGIASEEEDDPQSTGDLYRLFGGTSAASSIVAGIASLLIAAGADVSRTAAVDRLARWRPAEAGALPDIRDLLP